MKKIGYLSIVLAASIGLSACGQEEPKEEEKVSVTQEKETVAPVSEEVKEESLGKQVEETKEEQTINPDEPVSKDQEQSVYQNQSFKDVVVVEKDGKVVVSGKAQVFEGNFQYKLSDGDKVLLENHYQTAADWGEFEIEFEKELVNNENIVFELFVYSAKDGSIENVLEIPIQK